MQAVLDAIEARVIGTMIAVNSPCLFTSACELAVAVLPANSFFTPATTASAGAFVFFVSTVCVAIFSSLYLSLSSTGIPSWFNSLAVRGDSTAYRQTAH